MGTWRWNIKTDQDTRDASFNSMLGLKATESTQSVKDFIQYVHPDDRAAVDEEIKRAIRERDIYRFEFRIVRPDGTIYWLSDRGKVYYDQKNDPAYMTGAVFNITERKQAEELLWESQEQYRALVENTAIGITVIDTHYKIITANTMLSKLFNRPASDFVGKNCFREYEKREAVCPHCPGVRAMASGNTEEVETQGVRDDGSRFYVRNRAVPLVGPDGVMKGFIELVEDVTERRNKEKLILDANRRLEKVSEELSAAKRDLEQKNEALQKVCSELQQRVKEQTAQLAAANRSLGDKGYYK
jgi:PAS domain S-box-containing protein